MKMTINDIITLAQDERIYKKGRQLFDTGAIRHLTYNHTLNAYYAIVYDSLKKHEVILYLDPTKKISRMQCDCPFYQFNKRPCAHTIAVLWAIYDQQQRDHTLEMSNQIAQEEILNLPETFTLYNDQQIMVPVTLHIGQDPLRTHPYNQYYLEFHMGLTKSYILKDFHSFFLAIEHKTEQYLGKSFTYQPDLHTFAPAFLKTIEYLKQLDKLDQYNKYKHFVGKKVYLLTHQLKEVLEFWLNKTIFFQKKAIEITDDHFPSYIDLDLHAGAITCDVSKLKTIVRLLDDDTILIDEHMLYLVDPQTAAILHPFLDAADLGTTQVIFAQEKKNQFIERVIPQLEHIQTIPEKIQNLYVRPLLKAQLYLDKSDTAIYAKINFTYAHYAFDPFSKDFKLPLVHGKLILRDYAKEQKIIRILEKADFAVAPNHLYLDDDEKIQRFVFDYLPHLQSLTEIYYSDHFQTMIQKKNLTHRIHFRKDINLFEVDFDVQGLNYPEFQKILESYHYHHHYYRLKDGSFLDLDDKATQKVLKMIDDLHVNAQNFHSGKLTLPISRAFYMKDMFDQELSADQAFTAFIQQFENPLPNTSALPQGLNGSLREYQIIGFQWLKTLAHYHLGGILADDMGLGKTLQTIAYILDDENHHSARHLIVCPTSLLFNWQDEIQRFAPSLKIHVISGSQQERANMINQIKSASAYVLLTSYPLLRRDYELYQDIHFTSIILDEAQYIKNAFSLNAKAAKAIQADVHFALTGTPIENSLSELWSIFDFILPNYFSSHHYFHHQYERPILKDQDEKTSALLQKQIEPFILRRMKKDVLKDLPEKMEAKIAIDMSPKQKEVYYSYLAECQRVIAHDVKINGINEHRFEILSRLTHLRQLCNHPRLFLENYDGQSAKLNTLIELLKEATDGKHHILVFSQFTQMLAIIKDELERLDIPYFYLDGQTKMDERGQFVKQFNDGLRPVFLISLKAGGTGLNLVGADIVIHVDPWWNPAVEDQATDRAYRIGQKQNVQVYKLITRHSIEEKIYEMQLQKKDLIQSVITPGETFLTHLSEDEILDLFKLDQSF